MKKWSTACLDWEKRIVKGESLIPFAPLFPANAIEGLAVFDALVMVDAPGQPTLGEVSRQWVRDFVGQIFGSYEDSTGIRHITEYFMLIAKKNGKSTDAAGIMLTALILNWRHDAEFIILSPTIEIAQNSFKPAASMVRADPALQDLFTVQDHIRTITHRITGATLKVVAATSETVSGKKAVGVLVDELWLLGKNLHADNMLLEATGGLTSRPEGFVIYLTTQSDDPPAGVFKKKLDYARNVRDGLVVDPQFLPVLYEFPREMVERGEHKLTSNFYVTNPNLIDPKNPAGGGSVSMTHLEREWRKAQETDEEEVRRFLAKHLNVEIGMNLRSDRWPGAEFWEPAAKIQQVSLAYLIEHCEVITGGVDGGGLDDLLGAAFVGREKFTTLITIPESIDPDTGEIIPAMDAHVKRWVAYCRAWAHPSVMKRRQDIATTLLKFRDAGLLTIVRRIGEDTEQLAKLVSRVYEAGLLYQVGFDPACIGGILDAILQEAVDEDKMVKVNQGFRLAASIKTSERKLAEGVLVHDGNAMMNWCVSNAKCVVKGNGTYITKQLSGTSKIDPLIALFNAVELMALNPPAQNEQFDVGQMEIAG